MRPPLTLSVHRSEIMSASHIAIIDDDKCVQEYFTDEMAFGSEAQSAKRKFMDDLCFQWFHLYGERITATQDFEAHEWVILYADDDEV